VLPVRGKPRVGLYLGPCEEPDFACQPVQGLLPHTRPLPRAVLDLVRWVASYYLAPEGRAASLAAPGFVWKLDAASRREKRFEKAKAGEGGAPALKTKIRGERPVEDGGAARAEGAPFQEPSLTPSQALACDVLLGQEGVASPLVTLLRGVTGSGKTEVYLAAAARTLARGRNVLVLVPEIALTPQMSGRFRATFGEALAVLHSGLTATEHEREWFRVLLGQARVVLGVRSAVFAPLADVGLVVVDEEHDQSYKCEEFPCYQARDVAVKRAHIEGARCVLGSASPSLESHFNSTQGRYGLATLEARFVGGMPEVEIIDARLYGAPSEKRANKAGHSSLYAWNGKSVAPPVFDALRAVKARGEQAMIIVNRRGFANYALCGSCGETLRCPNCSVTTTLHKFGQTELCHYCGFTRRTLAACPHCASDRILAMGTGTQNVEAELAAELPGFRTGRLDRDVLTSNTRLTSILHSFRAGELDGLVGTQILSKGHDFPKVSLVVLLHVEDALLLPDFRAAERTFQLVLQSAGRAGRSGLAGKVLVQSLSPQLDVVHKAVGGELGAFLEEQLELRRLGWHPPVSRQILFEIRARSESRALDIGMRLRSLLAEHWKAVGLAPHEARLAGPVPATIEKMREEFRFQLCVSAQKSILPHRLVPPGLAACKDWPAGAVRIDVDPFSFM